MKKSNYSSIETILSIAKKGGMFILVDDEKRENEGDLVISTILFEPRAPAVPARQCRRLSR